MTAVRDHLETKIYELMDAGELDADANGFTAAAAAEDVARRRSRSAPVLAPVGPAARPNGETYQPREIGAHEDLALLRAARAHREHVLLYGPPGTGKTALAEAAFPGAETIVVTADTTEADFVGTWVQNPATGIFEWRPGPLHRSVLANVPLYVDEIALADPRVLSALYPLMDGRDVLTIELNPDLDPIPVGDGWILVAAYNPGAPGVVLAEPLRDRFTHHLEVGSDWELAADLGVPATVINIAENLDRRRQTGELTWAPQLRALLQFKTTADRYGEFYAAANLIARAPEADQEAVRDVVNRHYPGAVAARLGGRHGS